MTRPVTASGPLLRLLRAARRRLWWDAIVRRVPLAAWVAGLTLLAAGGAALLPAFEPDWTLTAGLVCLGILAALAPAVAARPSLTEAALHADRIFGSRELFVSAVETGAGTDSSPAARAVARQAQAAAEAFLPERRRLRETPRISAAALALVPAFLGLLALRLADPADEATAAAARESRREAGTASLTARERDERSAQRLRQTLTADAGEEPDASRGDARVRDESPSAARPDAEAVREERDEIDSGAPGYAAATTDGGIDAGDAKAGVAGEMDARDSGLAPATAATFARQGKSAASAASRTGYTGSADPSAGSLTVRPAAAPPHGDLHTRLSPAQTAYARRYLEATGDGS